MEDGRIDVPGERWLKDPKWIMDLAFLLGTTQELNTLNLKLLRFLKMNLLNLVSSSQQLMNMWRPSPQNWVLCKTQLSANIPIISQHADLPWKRAQRSVVMNMPLLLETHSGGLISILLSLRHMVTLSSCLQSPSQLSAQSVMRMENIDLQCKSEIRTKFGEA